MKTIKDRYLDRRNALAELDIAIKELCAQCELRGKRPCPFREISHDYCNHIDELRRAVDDAMSAQVNYWLAYERGE